MKSLIFLALLAVAAAGPVEILSDGTYHKVLDQVDDVAFYDQFWDNQQKYMTPDNFILNGTDARLGQFPWAARVTIARSTGGGGLCTGSFIAINFALTASHCVNSNPQTITSIGMLVGTVDRSIAGGTSMQMAEFWWHPQPATLVDDIALIRSTVNLALGPNIGFIRIPTRAQTNNAFHGGVTLIGWGLDNTGAAAIRLQFAPFVSVPFTQCTAAFREPSEICSIDPEGWRLSQGGDSGSSVVNNLGGIPLQVGIHAGRRSTNFLSAARVSAFLPWLEARGIRIEDN